MKSGYSPPAMIVPTASAAVWPVSHVSSTLAPTFLAMISFTSLPSFFSEPGIAMNIEKSMISSSEYSFASSAQTLVLPANADTVIADTKNSAIMFLRFIFCSSF